MSANIKMRASLKAASVGIAVSLMSLGLTLASDTIYLDVKPANTTLHLESIRRLPLSSYRLTYERSDSERRRVGVVGDQLAAIVPDAVDIIQKRTLPPREKGGKPVVLTNFPSVNEQTLFMYR